jgi:hypothetical protein
MLTSNQQEKCLFSNTFLKNVSKLISGYVVSHPGEEHSSIKNTSLFFCNKVSHEKMHQMNGFSCWKTNHFKKRLDGIRILA